MIGFGRSVIKPIRDHSEKNPFNKKTDLAGIIKVPIWGGSSKQQMYGNFGGFPLSTLSGNVMTPVFPNCVT